MGRLKKILIFSSIFFLASCGIGDNDNGEIEVDSQEPTEQSENVESEEVDWKDATGDIDCLDSILMTHSVPNQP